MPSVKLPVTPATAASARMRRFISELATVILP
jgi:hypothetical protein